jgi:hypothetical protein
VDPDGKDAIAWTEGNTIHVAAKVYIKGYKATDSKAKEIEGKIMAVWGQDFSYKDQSGKIYNVKFHANVEVAKSWMEKEDLESWENLVTLVPGEHQSNVVAHHSGWKTGRWAHDPDAFFAKIASEWSHFTYAHEFGHLLHCDDLTENGKFYTIDGNVNVMHGISGQVDQFTINDIASYVLKNEVIENDLYETKDVVITGGVRFNKLEDVKARLNLQKLYVEIEYAYYKFQGKNPPGIFDLPEPPAQQKSLFQDDNSSESSDEQ